MELVIVLALASLSGSSIIALLLPSHRNVLPFSFTRIAAAVGFWPKAATQTCTHKRSAQWALSSLFCAISYAAPSLPLPLSGVRFVWLPVEML